jgi:hypothetical protein
MALRSAARRLAPAAVPFVLAVVLFAPATLGGKVLSSSDIPLYRAPFLDQPAGSQPKNALEYDAAYVFEPDALQVRQALRSGHLPVWAPDLSAGRPLLASQQSAPFYPPNWLGDVFPFFDALAWIAVLKLTLAGAGLFLLARALGRSLGASLLGGVAFGFGTYLIAWLGHPHVNAYVLLPWLIWLAERTWRTGDVRDAAGLGLTFGVAWLGGQPESGLFVTITTAAWLLYRAGADRPPLGHALRRLGLAAGAAVLGLALAAIMLIPFGEALQQAEHASRSQAPTSLSALLTLAFPDYWAAGGGPINYVERTFYVGALPLMLAAAALVVRRPRGPRLFFAGLVLVALVAALNTGIATVLGDLPVLDQVNLGRAVVLASFGLAVLAAYGADEILAARGREWRRIALAAAAVAVLPVLAAIVHHPGWISAVHDGARRFLGLSAPVTADAAAAESVLRWIVFAGAALLLGLAATRWRRHAAALAAAAILLVAVDLLAEGWGFNPAITKAQAEPTATAPITAMRDLTANGSRVVGVSAMEPNTASRWGLLDVRGHEDPSVNRVAALWSTLGGGSTGATEAVDPLDPRTPKLLDLFGVRAILLEPLAVQNGKPALAPPLRDAPIRSAGPHGLVVENPAALPPAFVAYRWRASPNLNQSLLGLGLSSAAQSRDAPIVEGVSASPGRGRVPPATPARVVSRTDTSVTLDAAARAPGRLVLLDTFYPGWKAQVDGKDVPIAATNAAFRSVPIPAGRHRVTFTYHPASVRAGLIVSLVALVLLLAGLVAGTVLSRRRARPSAPAPARP